jgi:Tol biopolymer transport system component
MFPATGDFDIYVVSLPYLDRTPLAQNFGFDGQPAWSPDGTKIAFTSVRPGQQRSDVYTVDPGNTTDPVNLTNDPATDQYPSWSPDGRKLAFSSTREGNTDVYVMNADGSAQTRLTTDAADDYAPVWSPDGRKILFLTKRHGNPPYWNNELYVMNADGTVETRITSTERDELDADWQPVPNRPPDCSRIVAAPDTLRRPIASWCRSSWQAHRTRTETASLSESTPSSRTSL